MKINEEKVWTDETTGLLCRVVRRRLQFGEAYMCGYVAVLNDHSAYGDDYMDYPDINVHGSLTYSGEKNGKWWFGFDCNHLDDTEDFCTPEYAMAECAKLAKQLQELAA